MGVPRESVVILTKVYFTTVGPSDINVNFQSDTSTLK
jgi:hypothetical protein